MVDLVVRVWERDEREISVVIADRKLTTYLTKRKPEPGHFLCSQCDKIRNQKKDG